MSPAQALRLLGLKPADDTTAIRRAYAAKLKAMDVDADPAGYAALRNARDSALRAAKARAKAAPELALDGQDAAGPEEDDALPRPWPYGAPSRPDLSRPDLPLLRPSDYPRAPVEAAKGLPATDLFLPAFPPAVERCFTGPPVLARTAELPPGAVSNARPDPALHALLHANTDESLGAAGLERANGWLREILAEAARAELNRHSRIEWWVADTLAATWPRSAPLLPPAAAAFGWESERGQLSERPAIAWLNARLRGFRFQTKVVEPGHRLHKAWAELHRPGRVTAMQRLRVKKGEVSELLRGVREHFPELEEHFDPQRVASWDAILYSGSEGSKGKYRIAWFAGILLIQAVRFLDPSKSNPEPPEGVFGPPAAVATADPDYDRIRDEAIIAAFGPGKTVTWLRESQATLSASFESRIRSARASGASADAAIATAVEFVNRTAFLVARQAKGDVQSDAMAIHLAYADAAAAAGPVPCMEVLRSHEIGAITVPASIHKRENALAAKLIEEGKLVPPNDIGATHARVPGALIGQVIATTGLSQKDVAAGLQETASPATNCKVKRALLRSTLKWQGPERTAIFRTV